MIRRKKWLLSVLCVLSLSLTPVFSFVNASAFSNTDSGSSTGNDSKTLSYFFPDKALKSDISFDYMNFNVLKENFPDLPYPKNSEEYDIDQYKYKDYSDIIFPSIKNESIYPPDFKEKSGFDVFSLTGAAYSGLPPSRFSVLEGDFKDGALKKILTEKGYIPYENSGEKAELLVYKGDLTGDINGDFLDTDGSFLFGGQQGQKNPVLISDNSIMYSADGTELLNSLQLINEGNERKNVVTEAMAITSLVSGKGQENLLRMRIMPFAEPMADEHDTEGNPDYNNLIIAEYLTLNGNKTKADDYIILEMKSREEAEKGKTLLEEKITVKYKNEFYVLNNINKNFGTTPENFKVTESGGKYYISFILSGDIEYKEFNVKFPYDYISESLIQHNFDWVNP